MLRKEEKPVSKEKKRAISAKVGKTFQTDDKQGIVIDVENKNNSTNPNSHTASAPQEKTDIYDSNSSTTNTIDDDPDRIELVIQGLTYVFWITWANNTYDDGIKLSIKNENNEFDLCINYGLPYYGEGSKTQKELELIQKMAITIAASIITARKNGDKEAYRTLNIINSIFKGTK